MSADKRDVDDRKQKRKMEDSPNSDKNLGGLLTLRLGNSRTTSKKSLKISNEPGSSSKPADGGDNDKKVVEGIKEFKCKICDRKFRTSQALGGHQNAHRIDLEKRLPTGYSFERRRMVNNMVGYGHGYNSAYSMSPMPNLGPFVHPRMPNLYPPMGQVPHTNIFHSWPHCPAASGGGYGNPFGMNIPNTPPTAAGAFCFGNQFKMGVPNTPPTNAAGGFVFDNPFRMRFANTPSTAGGGHGTGNPYGMHFTNTPPTVHQFGVNNNWGGAGSSGAGISHSYYPNPMVDPKLYGPPSGSRIPSGVIQENNPNDDVWSQESTSKLEELDLTLKL